MAAALCTPPRVRKSIQNKRPLTDHKRVLFPTSSPDSLDESDQNLACSLSSSPSTYSPPLPSPTWSRTPRKSQTPQKDKSGDIFAQVAHKMDFNELGSTSPYVLSPRRSPRVSNKSSKQCTNLDILTMLESPGKVGVFGNDKNISSDFITPKSGGSPNSRRSPRKSPTIKPNNFYGSSVGLLARNEANSVAGIKKIYRVPVTSKAKTKLFADSKPRTERKKHSDVVHKMKKRKEMFTGVCHSLKPVRPEKRKRSSSESSKQELFEKSLKPQQTGTGNKIKKDVRERINEALSISKMTYSKQKAKKSPYPVVKFTKPDRMDVDSDSGSKRKIFKTSLKTPSRAYLESNIQSPVVTKKRKLLNPEKDIFNTSHMDSASDILDLIEDGKVIDAEEKKVKEGVDDLILQLDDELDQENVKNVMSAINDKDFRDNVLNLSNLSIMDDADKLGSEGSDVLTSPAKENAGRTPKKLFPVFEKRATQLLDLTNQSAEKKQSNSANKKWHSIGENQYQIDAGQKRFGAKQCPTCGIVYQLGDPDDEVEHERYHRHFKTFKHTGWNNEKVVGQYGLDRVIMVKPENKAWWNKVLSILKVVDEELGYTTEDERVLSGLQVYLYVNKKHIAGCLVATQISHAYKMLISEPGIDICSEDSFPVKCGISRIWTHQMYRRQGIASRLVDTMRKTFFFGYCLTMDDFAFSAPTEDGKNFAKKYTGKPDYLIYTGW